MSDVAVALQPPSRGRRIVKIIAWIAGLVVLLGLLHLAGVDVWGWLTQLWDTVTEISLVYVVLGCVFQGAQTVLTALGWYGILRYAYPGGVEFMPVLAAYAAGVALNNFLPANIGTFVTLVMYVAIVRGSTFPGILAGYVVQKIFYLVIGTLIYVYLFTQVTGSFDFQFGDERDAIVNHPVLTLGTIGGAIFLVVLLLRIFWRWVKEMWARAKKGAAILGDVRAYLKLVVLPQAAGYAAKVLVIVVFLAAYSIPVTFGSIMSVLGSNQLANILSFTPGGVGVNQAFNTFALDSYTDSTTATAYSIGQQLVTTAFNVGFAVVLICIVFGWSGGSKLVKDSYADAKGKAAEMKANRGASALEGGDEAQDAGAS
ncbi:MAG: flippase-like domain-containing protein [Gaiella sp.]|nr:flippase-like domain-containing protein [Gaiella sp.]